MATILRVCIQFVTPYIYTLIQQMRSVCPRFIQVEQTNVRTSLLNSCGWSPLTVIVLFLPLLTVLLATSVSKGLSLISRFCPHLAKIILIRPLPSGPSFLPSLSDLISPELCLLKPQMSLPGNSGIWTDLSGWFYDSCPFKTLSPTIQRACPRRI